MTELEKAKCGRYEDIDLNALAEEVRAKNYDYMDTCAHAAKTSSEEFKKISIFAHVQPAEDMIYAITALLMRVNVKDALIAQYMAALSFIAPRLANMTQNPERTTIHAGMFKQLLDETTTTVHCSVPDTKHHKTDEP